MGRLIDDHPQGKGPGKLLADLRFGAAESACPGNGRCVVTPCSCMGVFHGHKVFEDEVLDEDAGHF